MFTITSEKRHLQVEGLYDTIKLVGNAEIRESKIESLSGSVYQADGNYLGSFNAGINVSVNIDNKENAGLMSQIAQAVCFLLTELSDSLSKEGGQA